MRTSEDPGRDGPSRGGWMLLWRLYRWSTRNCRAEDLLGDEAGHGPDDHKGRPADALA